MSNRQDDALPGFIRRDVERAIDEAVNSKGMGVHDGKARIGADRLQYMLSAIASLQARLDAAERMLRGVHQEIAPGGLYAHLWSDVDRFLSGDA